MLATTLALCLIQSSLSESEKRSDYEGAKLIRVVEIGEPIRAITFSEDLSHALVRGDGLNSKFGIDSFDFAVSILSTEDVRGCLFGRGRGMENVAFGFDVDSNPWRLFFSEFPELAIAVNAPDGSFSFVDTLNETEVEGGTELGKITLKNMADVVLAPNATDFVFSLADDDSLVWINTASYTVETRITEGVGPGIGPIAKCPDGRFALIANTKGNTISVLDFESRRIVEEVTVEEGPADIAIHPNGLQAYVVCERSQSVCVLSLPKSKASHAARTDRSKVFMLGTIHGGHETSEVYDLKFLEQFIREVNPDYLLAEIPPNRARSAMEGFLREGKVVEERVMRFPEYLQVVYPLTRELDFEIIPTAGWTEPMARFRRNRLKAISEDPARAGEWAEYLAAGKAAEECQAKLGPSDDPYLIHTNAYDDCVELDLSVYDRLFNKELGPGGWTAINQAHYGKIEDALDKHSGEGQSFLITYGAGHKGWFLRELRKRTDIELIDLAPYFKQTEQALGRN